MRENRIQDFNAFSDRICDLVLDYVRFSTEIDPDDGIFVDEDDNVSLMNRNEVADELNFYLISDLVREVDGIIEVKMDTIDDITSKYIFVR